jgi:hypothetical protein
MLTALLEPNLYIRLKKPDGAPKLVMRNELRMRPEINRGQVYLQKLA